MSKHTPGPWSVKIIETDTTRPDDGCARLRHAVQGPDDVDICSIWYRTRPYLVRRHHQRQNFVDSQDEGEANAALIAAAPDLLDALRRCVHQLRSPGALADAVADDAEAIIAKATGGGKDGAR